MRMVRRLTGLAVVLGMVVMAAGCAKPPDAELAAAKNAVEEARKGGAAAYGSETFKGATDALQKAEEEIKAQGSRFALTRNYDKAKELLAKAKADAEKAKTDAVAGKEKAKGEAQAAQTEAQAALNEAKALLAKAPKGKGTKADIDAMEGDLKTAEGMLPEIQAALDKEDYLGAKAKAQSVKDRATSVSGQVQQAMKQKGKAGKK